MIGMFKKISALIITAALCAGLSGCGGAEYLASGEAVRTFYAMNTVMIINAYGKNSEQAVSDVQDRILELEKLWSVTDENSEIYRLDHNYDHGQAVEVSDVTRDVVNFALDISNRTGGALDPTVYPVLSAWGFTGDEYRVPDADELSRLLKLVNYQNVKVTGNKIALEPGMMLDLGAAAKGCASDIAAEILREHGIGSALINLGGNIMTVGTKPDNTGWRIGVKDPGYHEGEKNIGVLTINNNGSGGTAIVTSGNYERFFTAVDGTVYGHIIDPKTGYPVDNDLLSATIISPNGLLCDALSTAMFVLGSEKAAEFWRENSNKLKGFDMLLITKAGGVLITDGISDSFSLTDKTLDLRVIN